MLLALSENIIHNLTSLTPASHLKSLIYLCMPQAIIAYMFSFFHWTVGNPPREEPGLSLVLSF